MPDNKLVIRRLPPSMSEDEFLKHISPLPEHDYLSFFEANSGLGPYSFSRAYINFIDSGDMLMFRERFDNYVFLDKDGHEYPAVVEQSMWHKSPKNGPFFKNPNLAINTIPQVDHSASPTSETFDSNPTQSITDDPDFHSFVQKLKKKRPQQSPIQTLEANLDELAGSASSSPNAKDTGKVVTPLIGFVNQRISAKVAKKKQRARQ